MISRKVNNVKEALEGIQDGQTIMLGGFGLVEFRKQYCRISK